MCCPYLTTLLSGSPIIQNGKLVGAVTHVLIANPTEGYGIFILLANITVFTVALRAMLRKRSVRGAICALSLTSILVDSLRLIIENMLNAAQMPQARAA